MLLIDPLGAFERVRDNFILYVQTAFRTRFPSLERDREALLRRFGEFHQMPFVEPRFKYPGFRTLVWDERADAPPPLDAADTPGLEGRCREAFLALLQAGLFRGANPALYRHQVQMLRTVLGGRNGVVTTGTGSGKTEAFLMPLLGQLVKERFAHATRQPALRALILYPMNALVEDQLNRLRVALDSDGARDWFRSYSIPYPVSFARYNSLTPVAGYPVKCLRDEDGESLEDGEPTGEANNSKLDELRRRLQRMRDDSERLDVLIAEVRQRHEEAATDDARASAAAELDRLQEARSFFWRHDGPEMVSRWDIQAEPPDLLVTNFSMLSVMLMRQIEDPIFSLTRDWLVQNDDAVFHLVIDELHLYRGTAGTEVAYLLRLLLERLGLRPGDPKLRVAASSASLTGDDAGSALPAGILRHRLDGGPGDRRPPGRLAGASDGPGAAPGAVPRLGRRAGWRRVSPHLRLRADRRRAGPHGRYPAPPAAARGIRRPGE